MQILETIVSCLYNILSMYSEIFTVCTVIAFGCRYYWFDSVFNKVLTFVFFLRMMVVLYSWFISLILKERFICFFLLELWILVSCFFVHLWLSPPNFNILLFHNIYSNTASILSTSLLKLSSCGLICISSAKKSFTLTGFS
jgi:hypothetical protein